MKGCLKHSSQSHAGSPCVSRTPSSSSSTLEGSTCDAAASTSTSSSPSQSGANTPPRSRKCVDFGKEICAQFFVADEWDRTPTEPARKLTYQDLLELKEIQRSLPRANQPPDDYAGRAAKCYLRAVPIGLLPLLPDSNPATPLSTPTGTPNGTPTGEPQRNPLSASNSPVGSGTSSPMRAASPERGAAAGVTAGPSSAAAATNAPWCVNFHRVRAPPPPVAPAYAPSSPSTDSATSAASSTGLVASNGSRFAKFPYPPSPLHRGATPPSSASAAQEPVQDKRLAHLPPARPAPPRKRPMFAFLPLLDDGAAPAQVEEVVEVKEAEKEKAAEKEKEKAVEEKKKESTPTTTPKPAMVLTSTRDASREREDEGTHVEPEWPRHVYGSSSSSSKKPASPRSPTSPASAPPTTVAFKRPALPSDAGRYHGGFGGGYSGYVPPPPVRMVAASGLGVPIKKSLTAHAAAQDLKAKEDYAKEKDEGAYYGSHAHPYSPGSSRAGSVAGSVAGSRSASVERGGERERRLYAPHATFAAALLRVDELVQRAAAEDADEGSSEGDADVDSKDAASRVANALDDERSGRSETKTKTTKAVPRKTGRKHAKKEKRFIMVNDMQIELDGSDDEGAAADDDDGQDDDIGDDVDTHVDAAMADADLGMSLKAALEAPATPPTVYAYQLPTPTPTPPPVLSSATATPMNARSPAKTPMPASDLSSTTSSCLLGETAGAGPVVGAAVDAEPVRATTPTPINVMAPIRFKRAVPQRS